MKQTFKLFFLAALLISTGLVQSQNKVPDPKLDIERVIRNVAGNIIEHTSFMVANTETGEKFSDSKNLPVDKKFRVDSPYNTWTYWNGVLNLSFIELSKTLNDAQYADYAKKNVSFVFNHEDYFRKQYEAGASAGDMRQRFKFKILDDCGAMGAGILAVQNIDPQKRYRDYLNLAADHIMNKELRLEDGTLCRTSPFEMTVWGDDLYMSVPFLARMGALTGERKYFDEAAKQVVLFNKRLWDPQTRIFFHCWYDDIQQNGVAHWGRCNGWIIMAQVELLDKLPKDHPKRTELIESLARQIVGLSRYQDASGLWHQLIDMENTFLETSSTAMYTYAVAKAINEGWLDKRYAYIAAQGWAGLTTKVTADGQVEGVCMGTSTSTATYYYANRPTPLNDIHGLGAVLLAGCEVKKLYENGINYQW